MKRNFILLLLSLFILLPCFGERKKVGLVLGGGGAKGAAHVGVLKVFEEAGIPVDYIAGTSIGAIVGGMYSIGYTPNELDSMFRYQDWGFLFSDQVDRRYRPHFSKENHDRYLASLPFSIKKKNENPMGLITGHNIYNLFSNMTIGYHDVESFYDLPIPFACVAVDLVSGKDVVLDKGSLPLAMRSSMAIPGVFEPILMDSMVLIDGGMLNNLPVDVVMDMGAEIVIAIDLSTGWKTGQEVQKLFGMIDQMTFIMQNDIYEKNKSNADFYLNPNLHNFTPASFSRHEIDTMIQKGEDVARAHWDELILLKEKIYQGEEPEKENKRTLYHHSDSIEVDCINFHGVDPQIEPWVRKRIPLQENTTVSIEQIEQSIAVLYGMDLFSQVEYLIDNDEPNSVYFIVRSKPLNNLNVGLRFDSKEFASILLNTTINHQFMRGSVFSVTARLNKSPYIHLSEQFGGIYNQKFGLSYMLRLNDFQIYEKRKKFDHFSYLSHAAELYYSGFSRNIHYKVGLHYDYFHYDEDKYDDYFKELALHPEGFFNYFATFTFDNRNRAHNPTRGLYTNLRAQLYTDNLITYNDESPFLAVSFDVGGAIKLSKNISLLPSVQSRFLFGDDIALVYRNYMGGEINGRHFDQQIAFSGIRGAQLFNNTLVVGKLGLRYCIANKHYLSAWGEYANSTNKFAFSEGKHTWGTAIKYHYESILGPIGIEFNYSNNDRRMGAYVYVGYNF